MEGKMNDQRILVNLIDDNNWWILGISYLNEMISLPITYTNVICYLSDIGIVHI